MTQGTADKVLYFSNIQFYRDDESIFGEINFSVRTGELLLVEGPNGSGKTTLMRVIAGFLESPEGTCSDGSSNFPVEQAREHYPMAYLGHKPGFKNELTVYENLGFYSRLFDIQADFDVLLNKTGLLGFGLALARSLSAGQRKRLALTQLLLNPARIWLLDEPFANLDNEGIELVKTLVADHLAKGGSVVSTSHGTFDLGDLPGTRLYLGPTA